MRQVKPCGIAPHASPARWKDTVIDLFQKHLKNPLRKKILNFGIPIILWSDFLRKLREVFPEHLFRVSSPLSRLYKVRRLLFCRLKLCCHRVCASIRPHRHHSFFVLFAFTDFLVSSSSAGFSVSGRMSYSAACSAAASSAL